MTKKSFTKIFAGMLAMSLILTACGGAKTTTETTTTAPTTAAGAATEAPKKDVSFSVVYATGDPTSKQALADSMVEFMKLNPNITIKDNSEGTASSYLDLLKTKDAVGEFPDLVEMRDTQLFANAGKIVELPKDLIELFESVPEVDGKIYNAPISLNAPQGIIYSKKAYAAAGITADPKNFSEFLANQEKLKASGIAPIVIGGKDIFHWGFLVSKFMTDEVYASNPKWNSQRTKGTVSFTDANMKKAMNTYTDLFKKGYIEKGFMSTADNQTASMLVTGKAASLFSGVWMFNIIKEADPSFEFGFYPVPDEAGKINAVGLPSPAGWALSTEAAKDPDKTEAIKSFIRFFFSKDQYTKYAQLTSSIPTTKEKIVYEASPQLKTALELIANADVNKTLMWNNYWGEDQLPPPFRNWFYKLVQDWLIKGEPIDEYMKKADAEWDTQVKAAAAAVAK